MNCKNCNVNIKEGARFCTRCGHPTSDTSKEIFDSKRWGVAVLNFLRGMPHETWKKIVLVGGILTFFYGIIIGLLSFIILRSTDSVFAKKMLKRSFFIWIIWLCVYGFAAGGYFLYYDYKQNPGRWSLTIENATNKANEKRLPNKANKKLVKANFKSNKDFFAAFKKVLKTKDYNQIAEFCNFPFDDFTLGPIEKDEFIREFSLSSEEIKKIVSTKSPKKNENEYYIEINETCFIGFKQNKKGYWKWYYVTCGDGDDIIIDDNI